MKNIRSISFISVILFFALLCLPLIVKISGLKVPAGNFENRKKEAMPSPAFSDFNHLYRNIDVFFKQFDRYYADNFGLRELMLNLFTQIKVKVFRVNPFPQKAVEGENGWLFLGDSWSDVIKESKGIVVYNDEEVQRIVAKVLQMQSYFDQRGIKFYLAVAPGKLTIYSQYLPIEKSGKMIKIDQVRGALMKHGIGIIDMKDDFHSYREYDLYYKTDTHWNGIGTFSGYQTIMKRLVRDGCNELKILNFSDYRIDTSTTFRGGLSNMIRRADKEKMVILKPLFKSNATARQTKLVMPEYIQLKPGLYESRHTSNVNNLKILVFHDSFFQYTAEFFKEGFGETVLVWSGLDYNIVNKEQPDIVIYELAERSLDILLDI